MNPEDYEAFHEGIIGVMSFYHRDVSRFALDLWWRALSPYDLPAVIDAFNRYVTHPDFGQYPPKPADVVRIISGGTQDRALLAWAKVDRALRCVGPYESVVFDDPLIHRVLHDMGGWISLGRKAETEWPYVAREFENRYRTFTLRGETPEYLRVMVGIAESENARNRLPIRKPALIGNETQAKAVLRGGSDKTLIPIQRADGPAAAALLRIERRRDVA